jgi:hypothetical protein
MGFYIRKALSVGPFRFNLSKSGLGVSVGIKGLRLGAGPRGNYVHMGREGLYFRKSLHSPGASLPARRRLVEPETSRESLDHENLSASVGPMHEIESGPVEQMVDASSAELLRELNEKKRKTRILPPTIAASLVGALILLFSKTVPNWVVVAFVFFAAVLCWLARVKDDLRKTTVVLYDLEPDVEAAYAMLHEAFQRLRSCSKIWHIEARGAVKDSKYHAGATGIVQRKGIRPTVGGAAFRENKYRGTYYSCWAPNPCVHAGSITGIRFNGCWSSRLSTIAARGHGESIRRGGISSKRCGSSG